MTPNEWEKQLSRNIATAARSHKQRAVFVTPEIRRKVGDRGWQRLRQRAARCQVALIEARPKAEALGVG